MLSLKYRMVPRQRLWSRVVAVAPQRHAPHTNRHRSGMPRREVVGTISNPGDRRRFQSSHSAVLATAPALTPPLPPPPPVDATTFLPDNPPVPRNSQTTGKIGSRSIPTKHSRKRLPLVLTDTAQLTELTAELLETDIGRLFTFEESPKISSRRSRGAIGSYTTRHQHVTTGDDLSSSAATMMAQCDAAWEAADLTLQKVEAAVRGYARLVPGTMWNRWLPTEPTTAESASTDASASDILSLQKNLMDRIYEEGYAYMTVRAMRLEEMYGTKQSVEVEQVSQESGPSLDRRRLSILEEDHADIGNERELANLLLGEDADVGEEESIVPEALTTPSYMHDFALPGPTVSMYDTVLDTIACSAANVTSSAETNGNATAAAQDTLDAANYFHDLVFLRHITDGGDVSNTNPHTRPTAVTFNALIRTVSELPYHKIINLSDDEVQFRDDAVSTAITTLQAMHGCGVVHRNSATYRYTLHCVQKYMPASKIRGNIAAGIFHQARYFGLVNDSVVQAYIAANTPSNEAAYDDFIRDQLLPPGQWPTKWKRESRKRRYHAREDTY